MAENEPQVGLSGDDELSVDELENVAGGALVRDDGPNTNCSETCNGNCPCPV
jgi:hypothetical protein